MAIAIVTLIFKIMIVLLVISFFCGAIVQLAAKIQGRIESNGDLKKIWNVVINCIGYLLLGFVILGIPYILFIMD